MMAGCKQNSGMDDPYSGWLPNTNSKALEICKEAHQAVFGKNNSNNYKPPNVYAGLLIF